MKRMSVVMVAASTDCRECPVNPFFTPEKDCPQELVRCYAEEVPAMDFGSVALSSKEAVSQDLMGTD